MAARDPRASVDDVERWLRSDDKGRARHRAGLIDDPAGERFVGAWCFDAAALAVAYDIDDTTCRAVPEYPADLVDYARSLRA